MKKKILEWIKRQSSGFQINDEENAYIFALTARSDLSSLEDVREMNTEKVVTVKDR